MNNASLTRARLMEISGWLAAIIISMPGSSDVRGNEHNRQFYAEVKLFSVTADSLLENYQLHGGGGVGPGGRLGLNVAKDNNDFKVTLAGSRKEGRFLVHLTVIPADVDQLTPAIEKEFDLTNLIPIAFDLAVGKDGRMFRLSILPQITEHPQPKTFNTSDFAFEKWHFKGSQVILNGEDFLGEMNSASSPIAWVDLPGIAKVEFSLLKLTRAEPMGVLKNGTIRIKHPEGAYLQITNVLNGDPADVLQGGPYHVWVRWLEPSLSAEEHRDAVKQRLVDLKAQVAAGELKLPKGALERLEKRANSDRILSLTSGIRGTRAGDLEVIETEK